VSHHEARLPATKPPANWWGSIPSKTSSKVVRVDTPDEGAGLSISVQMLCAEHSMLLQHYEATLRRWAQLEWSSNRNEPNTLLRVSEGVKKKKALDERDAAREQLNLHERSCSTCIHNHHNPHLVK
jgi:hypothetical protein